MKDTMKIGDLCEYVASIHILNGCYGLYFHKENLLCINMCATYGVVFVVGANSKEHAAAAV